jgi:hypothetical protein
MMSWPNSSMRTPDGPGGLASMPNGLLTGPFATSYGAYRNVAISWIAE